jgi:integrase
MARRAKPRRRKGTGSVFPMGEKRWVAQVSTKGPDGKRRFITRWRRTEREANDALATLMASVGRGADPAAATQTLDRWMASWLAGVAPSIRPKSHAAYREHVDLHIGPVLGGISLDRLRPADVRRLIADRLAAGKSPTTVRGIVATLNRALRVAVREGVLVRAVTDGIALPRLTREPVEALTLAKARKLIAAVSGDRFGPLYLLLLGSGLRRGEALALDWRDVDLDAATVRVRAGKTRASIRTVPIPSFVVTGLRAHRSTVDPDAPVFQRANGQRLAPSTLGYAWRATLRAAGLPPMRLHDLRHAHATLLLASGTPMRLIAEQLGHANPGITSRVYAHVLESQQRAAIERLDDDLAAR